MSALETTIQTAQGFVGAITTMGGLIDDLVEKITDKEYLDLMNTLKKVFDEHTNNPIVLQAVRQASMRVRQARLSTEEKLLDERYTTCERCDRVVLLSGLDEHHKSKVCLNTYTSKMVASQAKLNHNSRFTTAVNFAQIFNEMLSRRDIGYAMNIDHPTFALEHSDSTVANDYIKWLIVLWKEHTDNEPTDFGDGYTRYRVRFRMNGGSEWLDYVPWLTEWHSCYKKCDGDEYIGRVLVSEECEYELTDEEMLSRDEHYWIKGINMLCENDPDLKECLGDGYTSEH